MDAYCSLQLLIQQVPITTGWPEAAWNWEVCPTLLHMTNSGNQAPDLLILSAMPYPLGHTLHSRRCLLYLLVILPVGVVSKKCCGQRRMLWSISPWRRLAARTRPLANTNAATMMAKPTTHTVTQVSVTVIQLKEFEFEVTLFNS